MNGDVKLQHLFFERYANFVLKVAWRYVKNESDAKEVLQLTMIKVFEKLQDFRGEAELKSWIRTIVVRQSLDFLRKAKRIPTAIELEDDYPIYVEEKIHYEVNGYSAEEIIFLLHKLPEMYQLVFNLAIIDELEHKKIATLLNISEINSRSILKRAKTALHKLISNNNKIKENNYGIS